MKLDGIQSLLGSHGGRRWNGSKRGSNPPKKRPISSPHDRAKFAALLSAHQYTRDDKGNIIPTGSTPSTSSSSSATPGPNNAATGQNSRKRGQPPTNQDPRREPAHGEHAQHLQPDEQGDKASTQARRDHQQRQASNPYLNQQRPHAPRAHHPHQPQRPPAQQPPEAQQRPLPLPQEHEQRPDSGTQHTNPQPSKARRVSFSLPEDHREEPPRPVRTEHVLRRLSNSSLTQLQLNGTDNLPVHVIDNRPEYYRGSSNGTLTQNTTGNSVPRVGDTLFVQPPHLTAATSSTGPTPAGQPEQPDIADLEIEAETSITQGATPPWHIEDSSSSMRASIRVGDVSFDISWFQGAGVPLRFHL